MSEQQPRGDQPPGHEPPPGYPPPQQPYGGQHGDGRHGGYGGYGGYGGGQYAGQPYRGGAPGEGPGRPPGSDDLSPADQRLWATLTHVGGILAPVLVPLVVLLVLRDRGLFVADQAREALNNHISLALYLVGLYIALGILTLVTLGLAAPLLGLPPLLWFFLLVFGIIAAMRANRGERYRYPLTLRLVR